MNHFLEVDKSYPPIEELDLVLVEPILHKNYERRSM
jgi:hypothetical protein